MYGSPLASAASSSAATTRPSSGVADSVWRCAYSALMSRLSAASFAKAAMSRATPRKPFSSTPRMSSEKRARPGTAFMRFGRSSNLINAVPGRARFSLDIRGVDENGFRGVARDIAAFAKEAAERRDMSAEYAQRQTLSATPLDGRVVAALEEAAEASGEPYMAMHSGAAHDTMSIADRVPSAMVFVPCKNGISHSPEEDAEPADAALGAE